MKRTNITFLLTLLMSMLGTTASAYVAEVDGIYYNFSGSKATVTYMATGSSNKDAYKGEVNIPPTVTYSGTIYTVTAIGEKAFSACSKLNTVTIPDNVTSIGEQAFSSCPSLTSVNIPNGVTSISKQTFTSCRSLTTITIPSSVTSIGERAFDGCRSLTTISIPSSVTSIGERAFNGCRSLTTITIPSSVISIGERAFSDCDELSSIVVEEGNTVYDSRENCNAIILTDAKTLYIGCKNTTIPSSVTSIGERAFDGCRSLTTISIPNSVTSIGEHAFNSCTGLTSVTIPNSVITICEWAFSNCSGLTAISIGNSVTSIGNYAFNGCSGLTAITIPHSVTTIGENAFDNCSGLTTVTIPNSVTAINNSVFSSCSSLTSVTIPSSVTSIGVRAFYLCSSLTSVYCFAESVPSTAANAFENSSYGSATLYVPAAALEAYQAAEPWSSFNSFEAASNQCAPPTIAFDKGQLTFTCETEGVRYVYSLSTGNITTDSGNVNPLAPILHVSVYAMKDGYVDSYPATLDIDISGLKGDTNGDGKITISDAVGIVNIILGNNGGGGPLVEE